MSTLSRLFNLLRRDRVTREIDEELQSHLDEAIENGRDPAEARRALGPMLRLREESRDARLATWLESLVADVTFGWRQIQKHKATSLAAVLSLGLAIGACGATFRLVDALLLRPLPVESPESLFSISYRSHMPDWPGLWRDNSYPIFRQLRDVVADDAELVASSKTRSRELQLGGAETIETAHLQYVSGRFFPVLGLEPSVGRLLGRHDDQTPGGHPVAVLSEQYWTRRLGADPQVIGKTFELADTIFEVVGVARGPFTGIEPGVATDIFVPLMMARDVENPDRSGFRILGRWKNPAAKQKTHAAISGLWRVVEDERWTRLNGAPREWIDRYVSTTEIHIASAASGFSEPQEAYRQPLRILAGLAVLLLLIACANVSNLLVGRTAARARELALRVAIGAGRLRVLRLLMAEAWLLGLLAAALGAALSVWLAPIAVGMLSSAEVPLSVELRIDLRFLAFFAAAGLLTCLLCGLGPALRASSMSIATGIKVGTVALRRRQTGRLLLASQVGFCVVVVLAGGLFTASLTRLTRLPTGFETPGLVNLEVISDPAQPHAAWDEIEERLLGVPGVANAALASWPLLHGSSMNARVVTRGGTVSEQLVEFFCVSPNWPETMGIPIVEGRTFRRSDIYPGVALVNQTFADQFFREMPIAGQVFQRVGHQDTRTDLRILGAIGDTKQNELRKRVPPVVYIPCQANDAEGAPRDRRWGTFVIRSEDVDTTLVSAAAMREIAEHPGFRVRKSQTQQAINGRHTVQERLLATLGLYFSIVALLLTGIGLFGVLHYAFRQRQKEVGVRLALGGGSVRIVHEIAKGVFAVVLAGIVGGCMVGVGLMNSVSALLFDVRPTDASMLAVPLALVIGVAALAALPVIIRTVRTDPTRVLRLE